ncbi:hypothetical protein EJ04DRAFT_223379 [Polyplosphaeria fusca]|uniref:Calcium channel YVC1-like C-terminal transmembrane domain-containing protein n=1 Tax=Polyplosphaeria fusca TaxID=682080 RepID=A0A9P4R1D2_9PLEO|nr:hypothetical protein EJ04DRAFT_223379 [Polyplosphaeria fusca]
MSSLPPTPRWPVDHPDVPQISDDEDFGELVRKLSFYFTDAITLPHTFEDLRSLPCGRVLYPLTVYLSDSVHHPALVSALLALKSHFSVLDESSDEPGVNAARGYACEYVAWQFLTNLTEREAIDSLLFELTSPPSSPDASGAQSGTGITGDTSNEQTPLLESSQYSQSSYFATDTVVGSTTAATRDSGEFTSQFQNLSALEIATVSGSKKFLSQRPVQKIINSVWRGDIVFWETLGVNSVKCPKLYNRRRADPFCRLRVPRYMKVFETLFFTTFLALYFLTLVKRSSTHVTPAEALLYVWIAGFAYDELGEYVDAGQVSFYASNFWWMWDVSIVFVGLVFFVLRIAGLYSRNGSEFSNDVTELAYDVLGLEALFLVPRIFSLLSLNPYFGTLLPCLKEMTKDFVKFLSLVVILYLGKATLGLSLSSVTCLWHHLGFLTTFVLLARGTYPPREMSWILVKVFFGSSYLGFDVAQEISPYFGPPVMLVFVALTNILLITSLISLLSNSLTKILDHAREEYLFVYSVYVLEASTSNRLTYFFPPLNLIPLLLRPLRLVLPSDTVRRARIVLLKATHLPFVGAIWAYEHFVGRKNTSGVTSISGPETSTTAKRPLQATINPPRPSTAGWQAATEGNGSTPVRSHFSTRPQTRGGPPEADPQLRSLVLKLTNRVEELTVMVSKLQERSDGSRVA